MKLITAVVKTEKLGELIDAVIDNGGRGLTATEAAGFGRQFGQRVAVTTEGDLPRTPQTALTSKFRLELLVPDDEAETMMQALAKHARTDTIGDGKIWLTSVEAVMRVRTGERGLDAL